VLFILGCPVPVPVTEGLSFSCTSANDCTDGYDCVEEVCVAFRTDAGLVTGDAVVSDAALDSGQLDGASLDQAVADSAAFDLGAADTMVADAGAADAAVGDTSAADSAVGDASTPDGAAADTVAVDVVGADTWLPGDAAGSDAAQRDGATRDAGGCTNPALLFNGGHFAQVEDQPNLDGMADLTVEAWVKPSALPTEAHIISHHSDGDDQGYVLMLKDGQLVFRVYSQATAYAAPESESGGLQLTLDQWHHIAGVYDGAELWVFVNGLLQARHDTGALQLTDCPDPLRIGGDVAGGAEFSGIIDEVRISSSARYSANFLAPDQAFTEDSETVALWHFDEGNQRIGDVSANRYDGTLGTGNDIESEDPGRIDEACFAVRHPGLSGCDLIYGNAPEFDPCEQTGSSCSFFSDDDDNRTDCEERCALFGGSCIDGFEEENSSGCVAEYTRGCSDNEDSLICVCSRP